MTGEWLLIFLVAFIVFGPNKLPMLARHLGMLWRWVHRFQQAFQQLCQEELNKEQLLQNQQKASLADALYHQQEV